MTSSLLMMGCSGAGGVISPLPDRSLNFESTSSQYLSMSDGNFGAFDTAKFAISMWFKRESTGSTRYLYAQYGSAGNRAFTLGFDGVSRIDFIAIEDGTNNAGRILSSSVFTDTSSWHHLMVHYDSANATAGDRMRMWHDGTEITSFFTDTNPAAAIFNSTADINVGSRAGSSSYDGLLYQVAFFSGSLPAISSVYNAGSPVDVREVTGLWSLFQTMASGSLEDDYVLSTNWTNTNTVITSTDIPT